MKIDESRTIAELVNEDIKTAHVFKKHGIDFCCGDEVSLKTAGETAKTEYKQLLADLLKVNGSTQPAVDINHMKPDVLADHIRNVHHRYIKENIPLIIGYAGRVVQVHAENYPELIQIQRLFAEAVIEL